MLIQPTVAIDHLVVLKGRYYHFHPSYMIYRLIYLHLFGDRLTLPGSNPNNYRIDFNAFEYFINLTFHIGCGENSPSEKIINVAELSPCFLIRATTFNAFEILVPEEPIIPTNISSKNRLTAETSLVNGK